MPKLAPALAACALLFGCGMSTGHVSVGDSLTIDLHSTPRSTAVQVTVGSGVCDDARSSSMAFTWQDGAARLRAC